MSTDRILNMIVLYSGNKLDSDIISSVFYHTVLKMTSSSDNFPLAPKKNMYF